MNSFRNYNRQVFDTMFRAPKVLQLVGRPTAANTSDLYFEFRPPKAFSSIFHQLYQSGERFM